MFKLMTSFTAMLCGLLLVGTAAKADYMKGVRGRCQLTISGKSVDCAPSMTFGNFGGRTLVVFTSGPLGTNSFSGGHDIQPDLNHYRLFVDQLALANHKHVPARGTCDTHINDDGTQIFSQTCSVTAANSLHFELTFMPTSGVINLR